MGTALALGGILFLGGVTEAEDPVWWTADQLKASSEIAVVATVDRQISEVPLPGDMRRRRVLLKVSDTLWGDRAVTSTGSTLTGSRSGYQIHAEYDTPLTPSSLFVHPGILSFRQPAVWVLNWEAAAGAYRIPVPPLQGFLPYAKIHPAYRPGGEFARSVTEERAKREAAEHEAQANREAAERAPWGILWREDKDRGVVVQALAKGSSAITAGLQVSDQVLEVNGRPVTTLPDWDVAWKWTPIPLTLKVMRPGAAQALVLAPLPPGQSGKISPSFLESGNAWLAEVRRALAEAGLMGEEIAQLEVSYLNWGSQVSFRPQWIGGWGGSWPPLSVTREASAPAGWKVTGIWHRRPRVPEGIPLGFSAAKAKLASVNSKALWFSAKLEWTDPLGTPPPGFLIREGVTLSPQWSQATGGMTSYAVNAITGEVVIQSRGGSAPPTLATLAPAAVPHEPQSTLEADGFRMDCQVSPSVLSPGEIVTMTIRATALLDHTAKTTHRHIWVHAESGGIIHGGTASSSPKEVPVKQAETFSHVESMTLPPTLAPGWYHAQGWAGYGSLSEKAWFKVVTPSGGAK